MLDWISVGERLPDTDGDYIVYAQDEGSLPNEGIWYENIVVIAYYRSGEWFWYDGIDEYEINEIVTHWMPLPEPPRMEKE